MSSCQFDDPLITTNQKPSPLVNNYESSTSTRKYYENEYDTSSTILSYELETGAIEEESIPNTASFDYKELTNNLEPIIKSISILKPIFKPLIDLQCVLEPFIEIQKSLQPLLKIQTILEPLNKMQTILEPLNKIQSSLESLITVASLNKDLFKSRLTHRIKIDKKEELEFKSKYIIERLSKFSEELQDAGSHKAKIELLVKFDKFLKDNKEFIRQKCPDKLVSILRTL